MKPPRVKIRGRLMYLWPEDSRHLRLLPRHGDPECVIEWVTQHVVKTMAFWPVYIAIVVTLILIVEFVILGRGL